MTDSIEPTDSDCVAATRRGERSAFAQLVHRHGARVFGLLWARTKDRDATEDLAQQTFLVAFRQLATLEQPDRFAAWMLGIAARAWSDWRRLRARTEVGLERVVHEPATSADDAADDRHGDLHYAIRELPETLRDTLVQFHFGKKSYRELAELFGVTEAAINARLTKARLLLRERLTKQATDHG